MNTTSEEILSLIINFEYLLKSANGFKFDIKLKVLHLINTSEKATPNLLIEKLGMARSNLAIMCNNLSKEGLIKKHKEPLNKKEIFYSITEKGKNYLAQNFDLSNKAIEKLRHKSKIVKLSKDLSKLV